MVCICAVKMLVSNHPAADTMSCVQVLSVPFYAWDQAQSLQQRAAYLDCLLASQSSHLATSQVRILPRHPGRLHGPNQYRR